MGDKEELIALRRMAELEARAGSDPYSMKNVVGAAVEPNISMLSGMVSTPVAGLTGIAGTLLPGPEGQGAEWTRKIADALTYQPRTEGGRTATEAISYPFRKLGEAGTYLGEKTAEVTGSPAVGAGVTTAIDAGVPFALSRVARVAAPQDTAPGQIAERLMRSAVKPTLPDLQSGKAGRAIRTMLDEGINPTAGGMEKLRSTMGALNEQVRGAIASSPETVGVVDVGSRLRDPYARARMQVNPTTDMEALRGVWDEFRTHPDITGKTEIPVQLAQALKSGTYRALGEKSYGEIGTAATEGQKALARGLRETIASKVPEVVEPLAREANLMNVLSVAERRALMEANKNPMGLALLANNPYAWAGFMADKSALFKSLVARLINSTAANPEVTRAGMTGAMTQMGNQP